MRRILFDRGLGKGHQHLSMGSHSVIFILGRMYFYGLLFISIPKKLHICKTHNTHTPTWAHPKTLYTYIYISTLTQCCLLTRPHTSAWYSHAHMCTHMTSLTFLFTTHINFLHTYMFTFTWTCSPIYIASIDRKLTFAHAFSLSKEILSFRREDEENEPRVLSRFLPLLQLSKAMSNIFQENKRKGVWEGPGLLVWISLGIKWSMPYLSGFRFPHQLNGDEVPSSSLTQPLYTQRRHVEAFWSLEWTLLKARFLLLVTKPVPWWPLPSLLAQVVEWGNHTLKEH